MYHLSHKFSDDLNGCFALATTPDVLQLFLNVIRVTSHSMFREYHRPLVSVDSSVSILSAILEGEKRTCGESTESRCRIPSCSANGLPRDLSMANEERRREKAVKKIETAVRKAVGKEVSQKTI